MTKGPQDFDLPLLPTSADVPEVISACPSVRRLLSELSPSQTTGSGGRMQAVAELTSRCRLRPDFLADVLIEGFVHALGSTSVERAATASAL